VAFILKTFISVFAILSRRAQCTPHVSTAQHVRQTTCRPSLQRPIFRAESHLRHAHSLQTDHAALLRGEDEEAEGERQGGVSDRVIPCVPGSRHAALAAASTVFSELDDAAVPSVAAAVWQAAADRTRELATSHKLQRGGRPCAAGRAALAAKAADGQWRVHSSRWQKAVRQGLQWRSRCDKRAADARFWGRDGGGRLPAEARRQL